VQKRRILFPKRNFCKPQYKAEIKPLQRIIPPGGIVLCRGLFAYKKSCLLGRRKEVEKKFKKDV